MEKNIAKLDPIFKSLTKTRCKRIGLFLNEMLLDFPLVGAGDAWLPWAATAA